MYSVTSFNTYTWTEHQMNKVSGMFILFKMSGKGLVRQREIAMIIQ